MNKIALLFLAGLLSAGCVTTDYAQKLPSETSERIEVVDSQFDKSRLFMAPLIKGSPQYGLDYEVRLVAVQDKATGGITNALQMKWSYTHFSWFFFSSSTLPDGAQAQSRVHSRRVISCRGKTCEYEEILSSVIPLNYLANATSGLKVRVQSQNGSFIIDLPVNYIIGYLQGVGKLAQ